MDKPALISLTFDDGLRCQFEQAIPILDRYDFPATFFLVANTDPIQTDGYAHPDWSKTDWSEKDIQFFKGMTQRGHEIGAHSVHHKIPFLSEDPKLEAEGSKRWIESRLELEIPSYCYPFCHITEPIKNAVIGAGYKQARWCGNEVYYPVQSPIDLFQVDCRHISKYGSEIVSGHPVGKFGAENVDGWIRPDHWTPRNKQWWVHESKKEHRG